MRVSNHADDVRFALREGYVGRKEGSSFGQGGRPEIVIPAREHELLIFQCQQGAKLDGVIST